MKIELLKLINFRNYEAQTMEFSDELNIIYGLNGQGKTNILEAINFCAFGSSFRTSKTKDLIRWNQENMYAGCILSSPNTTYKKTIEISTGINNKKNAKINGQSIVKMEELLGNLMVVSFSPDDVKIVNGSPAERRNFMNNEICQINPRYYRFLANYNKVLDGRNALLKKIYSDHSLTKVLDVWNEELVKYGSYIIYYRKKFIDTINILSKKINENITNGVESLDIKYCSNIDYDITLNSSLDKSDFYSDNISKENFNKIIEQIGNNFIKNLEETFSDDIKNGYTCAGPHKDDISISLGNINLRYFGSQGQKKTAALSLKLSEIELIKEKYGDFPILLLDDVTSELDLKRQSYLFSNINNIQVIVTCTDKNNFESILNKNKAFFIVEGGKLKKE